jgi:hypothetical protein
MAGSNGIYLNMQLLRDLGDFPGVAALMARLEQPEDDQSDQDTLDGLMVDHRDDPVESQGICEQMLSDLCDSTLPPSFHGLVDTLRWFATSLWAGGRYGRAVAVAEDIIAIDTDAEYRGQDGLGPRGIPASHCWPPSGLPLARRSAECIRGRMPRDRRRRQRAGA